MNIFDDRYKKLSLKELNEQEKNNILSTYSDTELEFIISELYKKIIMSGQKKAVYYIFRRFTLY